MLFKVQDGTLEEVGRIHDSLYRQWMADLPQADFEIIRDALNEFINTNGHGEIITTSWIPGSDWTNTPYQPLYQAVGQDWDMARFFFGLIVWNVMLNRPGPWSFGRYPRYDGQIIGLTYFRIHIASMAV
jgi:hypothetical protein